MGYADDTSSLRISSSSTSTVSSMKPSASFFPDPPSIDESNRMTYALPTTSLTTAEWMAMLTFLTRTGQKCTDIRQEFILLSDVWGLSALVDALNNPPLGNTTESSVLGPFFTEDAADIELGESIASEGKGEYMWVEGRVLNSKGEPIPDVRIETWETDA